MADPAGTIPVREAHRFDEAALARWLERNVAGYRGPLHVRQFEGGQSNPSFLLDGGGERYVLRKQPPGELLPSAHRVDREHRVISALAHTGVPVPRTFGLCQDGSVLGTPFFVMAYVPGRILPDASVPEVEPTERRDLFDAMVDVLARLHAVDLRAVGLEDFGRPGNYFARQVSRWSRQYQLSKTQAIPAMDALLEWLPRHTPDDATTTLVHGDYRLGNLIVHSERPEIVAVLDWELSTLGHPLADLAYNCVFDLLGTGPTGVSDRPGAPCEAEYLDAYRRRTGLDPGPHWGFCLAFSLFRLAAITQGVYARGLRGNASSAAALDAGGRVAGLAERAWEMASRA